MRYKGGMPTRASAGAKEQACRGRKAIYLRRRIFCVRRRIFYVGRRFLCVGKTFPPLESRQTEEATLTRDEPLASNREEMDKRIIGKWAITMGAETSSRRLF